MTTEDELYRDASDKLFLLFQDVLEAAIVRRRSVPGSSANNTQTAFTDYLRFGARAGMPERATPRYTFNAGTCIAIADAALCLVAQPEFMPESPIEDGFTDRATISRPKVRYLDYTGPGSAVLPLDAFVADDARFDAFDNVFAMTTRFFALHEQAHYYNGHLHLLATANAAEIIEEASLPQTPDGAAFRLEIAERFGFDWPRACRALELQADAWAVRHLLGFADRWRENHELRDPNSAGEIRSKADWARYALLGAGLGACVLELNDRMLTSDPNERSHPAAAVRLLTAFDELHHMLGNLFESHQDAVATMHRLIEQTQMLFETVGVAPISGEDFNAAFAGADQTKATTSWKACDADLRQIAPRLEPFGDIAKQELDGRLA